MLRQSVLILTLTTLVATVANPVEVHAQRRKRGKINPKIKEMRGAGVPEGKVAPTFDLKLLKAYDLPKAKDGKPRKTIKLADYRSKKPVVLIFGSYT